MNAELWYKAQANPLYRQYHTYYIHRWWLDFGFKLTEKCFLKVLMVQLLTYCELLVNSNCQLYPITQGHRSKPREEWRKLRHGYFRGEEKILWPSILYCEFRNVCFIDISSACMGHESQVVSCIVVFTLSLQFDNVIELQIKSNIFFRCKPFKHTF